MEESSFDEFYQREYHAVLALARVMSVSRAQAEDLTHDAFTAAWEKWEEIDNPSAWIRRVVSNQSRSALRRKYAKERALERMDHRVVIGSELPPDTEDFWANVRELPTRQAQAIALFYLEDRSVADIAQILGCAKSTARVHLTRGRKNLGKKLGVER